MPKDILQIITQRYSCRRYKNEPLRKEHRLALEEFLGSKTRGPLGSPLRLLLLAEVKEDSKALKGLGTYGFIRGAKVFMVGAVGISPKDLEDYGYVMEQAVLYATEMGLGTCWLGGTFTKSSFARKAGLTDAETLPAVVAVGYKQREDALRAQLRRRVGAKERLPGEELFFEGDFEHPLRLDPREPWAQVLEAVRWAPSASNKQPWRIVRIQDTFHFYLQRSKGYGKGSLIFKLLGLADLQRVDMGIAMCHFESAASGLGFKGNWSVDEKALWQYPGNQEYIATWKLESPATAGPA